MAAGRGVPPTHRRVLLCHLRDLERDLNMAMVCPGEPCSREMSRIAVVFSEARKVRGSLGDLVVIMEGAACGLVGSIPPAILFEGVLKRGMRVKVARGLASILASFAFMSAALAVVRMVARDAVLVFGVAMMATFVLFWGAEALRAWAIGNEGPGSKGRN